MLSKSEMIFMEFFYVVSITYYRVTLTSYITHQNSMTRNAVPCGVLVQCSFEVATLYAKTS